MESLPIGSALQIIRNIRNKHEILKMIDFQNLMLFSMLSFFSYYAGGVNSGSSGGAKLKEKKQMTRRSSST